MLRERFNSHFKLLPVILLALGATLLLAPAKCRAGDLTRSSQVHFRFGMLSGNFSGAISGAFNVKNTVDIDYEIFSAARSSYVLRAIIAHDFASASLLYSYAGVGKRYYLFNDGMAFESYDGAKSFVSRPTWRYYVGADAGISQVVIKDFGAFLQSNAALIDFGAHLGTIYQVSRSIGLELHGGYTLGYGFSKVSVGASTLRLFLGMSWFL